MAIIFPPEELVILFKISDINARAPSARSQ